MSLSRVISEIFNTERKCHDLEIRVRGHSRSLKVVFNRQQAQLMLTNQRDAFKSQSYHSICWLLFPSSVL